jgi:hypothetical protein
MEIKSHLISMIALALRRFFCRTYRYPVDGTQPASQTIRFGETPSEAKPPGRPERSLTGSFVQYVCKVGFSVTSPQPGHGAVNLRIIPFHGNSSTTLKAAWLPSCRPSAQCVLF